MTTSIKRTITIEYTFNLNEGADSIPEEHIEALEESAMDRIISMMDDGMREGELHDNIHMLDTDPEDGVSYSGWWKIKKDGENE